MAARQRLASSHNALTVPNHVVGVCKNIRDAPAVAHIVSRSCSCVSGRFAATPSAALERDEAIPNPQSVSSRTFFLQVLINDVYKTLMDERSLREVLPNWVRKKSGTFPRWMWPSSRWPQRTHLAPLPRREKCPAGEWEPCVRHQLPDPHYFCAHSGDGADWHPETNSDIPITV